MADEQEKKGTPKLRRMLIDASREIAAVIVAILLALGINEWWEDHEREGRKAELTEKLYLELGENLARLKASHQHHTDQLNLIRDEIYGKEGLTKADYEALHLALYRKGILKPALLTGTNWEIAKLTDLISYMEMEQLRTFTRVFAMHEVHDDQWQQNADAQVFANVEQDPEKLVQLYFDILNETWWVEKGLLETLEAALEGRAVPLPGDPVE